MWSGLNLIDAGNVVTPQDPQGLVVVTQIEPIAVLFSIPQAELPQVQLDLQSSGAAGLTVAAWSQDGTHLLDTGTLLAINNHVDPTSGTVILKAMFPNQKHLLWPGEFVNTRLVLHLQHDALSVPIDRAATRAFGAVRLDGRVERNRAAGQCFGDPIESMGKR